MYDGHSATVKKQIELGVSGPHNRPCTRAHRVCGETSHGRWRIVFWTEIDQLRTVFARGRPRVTWPTSPTSHNVREVLVSPSAVRRSYDRCKAILPVTYVWRHSVFCYPVPKTFSSWSPRTFDRAIKFEIATFIFRRLQGNPDSSGLQVAYWRALAVGGAAQIVAAHCPNDQALDPQSVVRQIRAPMPQALWPSPCNVLRQRHILIQ